MGSNSGSITNKLMCSPCLNFLISTKKIILYCFFLPTSKKKNSIGSTKLMLATFIIKLKYLKLKAKSFSINALL